MSIKVMSSVWNAHFHDIEFEHEVKKKSGETIKKKTRVLAPFLKSVCLALADHANDEGEGAYPSITRIENKTDISRNTVINCLRAMKLEGVIFYVGMSKRETCNYSINLEKLSEMTGWERQKREKRGSVSDAPSVSDTPEVVCPTHHPSVSDTPESSFNHPLTTLLGAEAPANINPNSGRRTDAKVLGDPMAGILFFAKQAEDVNAELENRVNDYPADCHRTLRLLVEIFGWLPASIPAKPARGGKGGAYAQWINEIREIDQGVGSFGQDGIRFVANACKDLTVSHPGAITWAIAGEIGKYARKMAFVAMSAPKPIDTPYTRAIENPSVISPENEAKLAAFRKRLRAQS